MVNEKYLRYAKELGTSLGLLFGGLVVAHFGVTLFLLAELGSDPFNVFVQGIFRGLSGLTGWSLLTHGRVHVAICFLIILTLLVVDRSYVRIGTIVCMVFGGPIIDFFTGLLGPLFAGELPMWLRVAANAIGCLVLAYGMTIVINSEAGTGPNDLVAIVLADKLKKKFSVLRVIVDCSFALIGFLLGGTVGIGTIICAFLVGPAAGVFMPINKELVDRVRQRMLKL